jgi:hypothetical protein
MCEFLEYLDSPEIILQILYITKSFSTVYPVYPLFRATGRIKTSFEQSEFRSSLIIRCFTAIGKQVKLKSSHNR